MKAINRILTWAGLVIGLFVAIKEAVEAVEVDEGAGKGEHKKALVLAVVGALYDGISPSVELPVSRERLLSIASGIIDAVVAFYNIIGRFRHGESIGSTVGKS